MRAVFRHKKTGAIVILILLLISLLSGCTDISGLSSPISPAAQSATLNLADRGPITLDPAIAADSYSASYIIEIFSGLVRLDEELQVIPDIAQSWDKSSDGRTFTFHLRQDVKFHDGKPVTASDFKYSWERALNPATNSQTARTYLNDIVGALDILSGKTTELSGVRVLDEYTLEVTIDAPKQYFLEKMAYPIAFVVDSANVQSGSTWWQNPNGTGPFKLQQWQRDQLVILARNDSYYGEKAKLDRIIFHLYSGNSIELYQVGTIDVTPVSSGYIGMATDPVNPISRELAVFPQLTLYYVGFDSTKPPFDDINVRQAFSYAVDKGKLAELSLDNVVTAAYGILPPGMPGYNSNLHGLHFDPQEARDLIAASKYGDVSQLPPIIFTTSGVAGDIPGYLGGIIEEWRRNLGVEVNVRQLELDTYLYAINEEKNNLFDNGWVADYPDPQNFLDILLRTGAHNNTGEYSNPDFDALLDRAAVEQDPDTRIRLYQEAEQIAVQDAAMLPLFFAKSYMLIKPYVKDYILSPLGYPLLYKVSIQR